MKCLRFGVLAFLTLPLHAGSIGVTNSETALLRTGDTLSFEIFTWNYALHAKSLGLPLYPTDINFSLVTSPLSTPGQFGATLTTSDASISVGFDGPLGFSAGYLSSADFQGAVSQLQGHLHLTPALSQDLFGGTSVRLNLENTGADLTLGLWPLIFRQDLFVTLSGGPLSVGAVPGEVTLWSVEEPPSTFGGGPELVDSVPEPGSGWLLVGGVAMLCAVSALLNKFSRARQ